MPVFNPAQLRRFLTICLCALFLTGSALPLSPLSPAPVRAQTTAEDPLDVTNYKIDAELIPDSNTLRATAVVTMKLSRPAQSLIFELNGSLELTKVLGPEGQPLQFVQDRLKDLNVRIALGRVVESGKEFTLTFEYGGQLVSAEGGVLPLKRLAYIGREGSYLMYAGRWFPFHGYASDLATYTVNLVTPNDLKVVGFGEHTEAPYVPPAPPPTKPSGKSGRGGPLVSEVWVHSVSQEPQVIERAPTQPAKTNPTPQPKKPPVRKPASKPAKPAPEKNQPATDAAATEPATIKSPTTALASGSGPRTIHTFRSAIPVLPGTIAANRYAVRSLKRSGFEVELFVKPGNEAAAERFGEVMAEAGEFFTKQFGAYAFGTKLQVAEIDNESLETYTTAGVTLLAGKIIESTKELPRETLVRETAYQWWGQAVGLKSFDDVWLSQGVATFSYLLFEQSQLKPGEFIALCRDFSERALAFESQTSIARAPAELDDQSAAYRSIIFYKGAFVLRMLQSLTGEEKLTTLLRQFYGQYRGGRASIRDFEQMAAKVKGEDLRYFFGQWIDSTGVPEFQFDYQIIRTKEGTFRLRGTIEQNLDNFRFPVELALEYKGGVERTQVQFDGKSAQFNLSLKEEPGPLVVDPDAKILRTSDDVRVAVIVRRAIQHMQAEEYAEAQQQFEAAAKLNRRSSWVFYNLGLLYMRQQNLQRALDAFEETLDGDLRPSWLEAWAYLKRGNVYDALGQRERATRDYAKAIEAADNRGNNYENVKEKAEQYQSTPYRPEREAKKD
ncbi:MAG: hypothetical protein K1Y36_18805 [Blastocatellia bacterium]|nr:hypothetical protein [Blastocatellia bacterium]